MIEAKFSEDRKVENFIFVQSLRLLCCHDRHCIRIRHSSEQKRVLVQHSEKSNTPLVNEIFIFLLIYGHGAIKITRFAPNLSSYFVAQI